MAKCPRCGSRCLEIYRTHSYCLECNFNSVEGFGYENKSNFPETLLDNLASIARDISKILDVANKELKCSGNPTKQLLA